MPAQPVAAASAGDAEILSTDPESAVWGRLSVAQVKAIIVAHAVAFLGHDRSLSFFLGETSWPHITRKLAEPGVGANLARSGWRRIIKFNRELASQLGLCALFVCLMSNARGTTKIAVKRGSWLRGAGGVVNTRAFHGS